MKKSGEILGLPIISIADGCQNGAAKMLIIDPGKRALTAIAVQDSKWYVETKVLPFADIVGIGENAITVVSSSHVITLSHAPDMEKLLAEEVKVIGTKAVSNKGRLLGNITEITIGEDGAIVSCELTEQGGAKTDISADNIITFGKDIIIVKE